MEGEKEETIEPPCALVDEPKSEYEAPTLRPTMDEFRDFVKFVQRARAKYPEYGLVKVIPPPEWKARSNSSYAELDDLMIPIPIRQETVGNNGVYQLYNIVQRPISVSKFKLKAQQMYGQEKASKLPPEEIDRYYWKSIPFNPALYGADMPGTLFDADVELWNLTKLPDLLWLVGKKLSGINEPYIYFGMWKASFAWHVEDMELYSINYLHFGAPKLWHGVPPSFKADFENMASSYYPAEYQKCSQFLKHKQTLISPSIVSERFEIPCHSVTQEEGQFVITWPGAYHSGYNLGYNCAEAVNFALEDWIPIGQKSVPCYCDSGRAHINMDYFLYRFEEYKYGKAITKPDLDLRPFTDPNWKPPKIIFLPEIPVSLQVPIGDSLGGADPNAPLLNETSIPPKKKKPSKKTSKKQSHHRNPYEVTFVSQSAANTSLYRKHEEGSRGSPRFQSLVNEAHSTEVKPSKHDVPSSRHSALDSDETQDDITSHELKQHRKRKRTEAASNGRGGEQIPTSPGRKIHKTEVIDSPLDHPILSPSSSSSTETIQSSTVATMGT